jgi:hypothetical protein
MFASATDGSGGRYSETPMISELVSSIGRDVA